MERLIQSLLDVLPDVRMVPLKVGDTLRTLTPGGGTRGLFVTSTFCDRCST